MGDKVPKPFDSQKFISRLSHIAEQVGAVSKAGNPQWKKFCQLKGLRYDLIMSWISKGNTPRAHGILEVAEALDVSTDWLLSGRKGLPDGESQPYCYKHEIYFPGKEKCPLCVNEDNTTADIHRTVAILTQLIHNLQNGSAQSTIPDILNLEKAREPERNDVDSDKQRSEYADREKMHLAVIKELRTIYLAQNKILQSLRSKLESWESTPQAHDMIWG